MENKGRFGLREKQSVRTGKTQEAVLLTDNCCVAWLHRLLKGHMN